MGAIGYHCIQLPYNPYITKVGPPVREKKEEKSLDTSDIHI